MASGRASRLKSRRQRRLRRFPWLRIRWCLPSWPACVGWDVVSRVVCCAQSGNVGCAVVLVHFPPQAVLMLQGCVFISVRLRGVNGAYLDRLRGGEGGRSLALSVSRCSRCSRWIGDLVTRVRRVNAFVCGLGTSPGYVQVAQCAIVSGVGPSAGAKTGAWEDTSAVGVAL